MQLIIGPTHLSTTLNFSIPKTSTVGIFMSAGLDSTSLLCLILEELTNYSFNCPIQSDACYACRKWIDDSRFIPGFILEPFYKSEIT